MLFKSIFISMLLTHKVMKVFQTTPLHVAALLRPKAIFLLAPVSRKEPCFVSFPRTTYKVTVQKSHTKLELKMHSSGFNAKQLEFPDRQFPREQNVNSYSQEPTQSLLRSRNRRYYYHRVITAENFEAAEAKGLWPRAANRMRKLPRRSQQEQEAWSFFPVVLHSYNQKGTVIFKYQLLKTNVIET